MVHLAHNFEVSLSLWPYFVITYQESGRLCEAGENLVIEKGILDPLCCRQCSSYCWYMDVPSITICSTLHTCLWQVECRGDIYD